MSPRTPFFGRALPALLVLLATQPSLADIVPPIQVQIREREPDTFLVQWRVPYVLPPQALPTPVLPEGSRPEGERDVWLGPSGWTCRQVFRCPRGLAGRELGMDFPVHNPSLATVFRVELLSGDRFARALSPLEDSWRVPEASTGALTGWLSPARSAVLIGLLHVLGEPVHLAFVLALILLRGATGSIRLTTAFTFGQLAGLAAAATLNRTFEPTAAEMSVAVAVVFLAREALHPRSALWRLVGFAAGAGLFHGVALAALLPAVADSERADWFELLALVLGMDAGLIILTPGIVGMGRLAGRLAGSGRRLRFRPALAYVAGGVAVAGTLGLVLVRPANTERATVSCPPGVPGPSTAYSGRLRGSRPLAPRATPASIRSFLTVEPFEVRHEVLLRVRDVAGGVELEAGTDGFIEIGVQDEVTRRLGEFVLSRTAVRIDGRPASALVDRASFMTADATGVLPRRTPVRELIDEALVGVTIAFLTDGVPDELTLEWKAIPDVAAEIPVTVIDPESSRGAMLTSKEPVVRWKNELLEDPLPKVSGIRIESPEVPVPLVSAALLAAALTFLVTGLRRRRAAASCAASRVALALALTLTPLARATARLPLEIVGEVSSADARRILSLVLPNVYRAFEFRREAAVYDRLAVAVTGDTLADIYLQHRRALEIEERGGARGRVDAVEVVEVGAVEPGDDGGFSAEATWTVGGSVTHFGHRHFRQNRYRTRVDVVPTDGLWKVRSIEVLEQRRVR